MSRCWPIRCARSCDVPVRHPPAGSRDPPQQFRTAAELQNRLFGIPEGAAERVDSAKSRRCFARRTRRRARRSPRRRVSAPRPSTSGDALGARAVRAANDRGRGGEAAAEACAPPRPPCSTQMTADFTGISALDGKLGAEQTPHRRGRGSPSLTPTPAVIPEHALPSLRVMGQVSPTRIAHSPPPTAPEPGAGGSPVSVVRGGFAQSLDHRRRVF